MNPTAFILKTALFSSTLAACPKPAYPADASLAAHGLVSPCAMVPVYDWPENQEPHEWPHLPHEERITVDSGASGNFTNSSARTISYSYIQTPFLRNLVSDKLIAVLDESVTAEEEPLVTGPGSELVRPDTKKHLSTASNYREERARVNRPRFDRPRS